MENKELVEKLLERWDSLIEVRKRTEGLRWEAMAYANHRTQESSMSDSPVPKLKLYSSQGVIAIENFINGFLGNLVSQNQNWASFRYESADFTDQDEMVGANKYLGLCQKRVMSELSNSNFYAEDRLASKDAFIGACSAEFITNDDDRDITVFKTLPPWDWWCDMDKYGEYDTFFYKKRMTAYRAYLQFGDKLPEEIIKVAKSGRGHDTDYDFLMCIYEREGKKNKQGRTIFGKEKRYACVWICLSHTGIGGIGNSKSYLISEDGYDRFPVIIHTWDSDGDNPYGTSPVIKALPELRRLNMLAYETSLTVRKINHSPYVMTPAASEKFSDEPGARVVVPSMEQAPVPLQQSQSVDGALELEKEQEEKISRLFYNDMFNYLSRQDKVFTATQVNAVKSEELSLLSAIFGNIQNQKINKLIKSVIANMAIHNRLPEGAENALGDVKGGHGKLRIVLDSMLAQALKAYTYRDSGMATLELIQAFMNMQMIEPIDNFDLNRLARTIAQGNGTDPSIIKDLSEVMKIQSDRARAQQEEMKRQQALEESEMVRNMGGAKNMNNSTGANQYA